MTFPFTVRPAVEGDLGFIVSAWSESYHGGWHEGHRAKGEYRRAQRTVIQSLLARATTLVACDPNEPDLLFGFACGEALNAGIGGAVIHYVYTRGTRRQVGLASALVAAIEGMHGATRAYTHKTHVALKILKKRRAEGQQEIRFNATLLDTRAPMSLACGKDGIR